MPITVTFDLIRPTPRELNRIRGAFERLGWQHLGNTAYCYPPLAARDGVEDWFNHVVPALMLLRTLARRAADTGRGVRRFTVDVQSTTGYDLQLGVGAAPLPAGQVPLAVPSPAGQSFGERQLRDWLDSVGWPYP